jgi:glucose-1-phosphatase
MATIQALIWDLGGVLLRTEDATPRRQLAERYGLAQAELEKLVFESPSSLAATAGQIREAEHWQAVFTSLRVPKSEQTSFYQQFWGGDRIDETMLKWIAELRTQYKVSLLSNAWSEARIVMGSHYHFLHVFDDSIFSAEVKLAKPDPAIFQLAASRLKMEVQACIFIDDVAQNVNGAIQAGMQAIQFKNPSQVRTDVGMIIGQ